MRIWQKFLFGINALLRPGKVSNRPLSVHLEPNNTCNLDCIMCDREAYFEKQTILDLGRFQQFYDQINPDVVSLHGYSEPLLHPQILSMAEYVKQKGGNANITTNLITLSDADALVKSQLDMVKISIDGATEETFDKVRGKGTFNKFCQKLELLNKARVKKKSDKGPFFRFNFTVTLESFQDIPKIISFAKKHQIDTVYFQALLFNYDQADKSKCTPPACSPQKVISLLKEAQKLGRDNNITTNISTVLANMPYLWKGYEKESSFSKCNTRRCLKPWSSPFIGADGSVKPCDLLGLDGPSMGNLNEESFEDIWNGTLFQEFRRAIKNDERPTDICKNCFPPNLGEMIDYRGFGKFIN
jgi:radical SAM protein with 4Fe4S-binding SPASM domain